MTSGNNFQVIFGVESDFLKEEMKVLISKSSSNNKTTIVYLSSPIKGEILPLSSVPDATFADKILGDGFAVRPTEGVVYAPFTGKVAQLFRTNHAIGITNEDGLEILIHVGIDTVKMNGAGFKSLVQKGDIVKRGQKILEFDLEQVRANAKSDITPIVITNMAKVSKLKVLKNGEVLTEQDVLEISLK